MPGLYKEPFLVDFDIFLKFEFQINLRFCFSNWIFALTGSELVVLNRYFSTLPFLVCLYSVSNRFRLLAGCSHPLWLYSHVSCHTTFQLFHNLPTLWTAMELQLFLFLPLAACIGTHALEMVGLLICSRLEAKICPENQI